MFEKIVARDKKLFLKINCFPHPRPLTWFFVFIDLLTLWGVVFATISLYLIIFGNLRQKEFGILGIYVILMTILINEVFLKKLFFKRERPHRGLNNVKLFWLTPRTGSFPSGQTTNIFSWTIFFSLYYQSPLILFMGLVFGFLTGFERIWLGAHYVSDVIGGMVIGSLLGWLWYLLVF